MDEARDSVAVPLSDVPVSVEVPVADTSLFTAPPDGSVAAELVPVLVAVLFE